VHFRMMMMLLLLMMMIKCNRLKMRYHFIAL
jgi:hypothetical protein